MSEAMQSSQASWEQLPEQSATVLREALIRSLELQNPNFDSPDALRAGVKEVIAQNKLAEVHRLLDEQISEENREELESLKALLQQEAVLYDFQGRMEKQMTPEEEGRVINFLKKHRLAIALIGAGLLIGWQGAALIALFHAPGVLQEVENYFSSASETVRGWWEGMKAWWSGGGGEEAQTAVQTEAGAVAEELAQEGAENLQAQDYEADPDTTMASPSPSDRIPGEPVFDDIGEDPFLSGEEEVTGGGI